MTEAIKLNWNNAEHQQEAVNAQKQSGHSPSVWCNDKKKTGETFTISDGNEAKKPAYATYIKFPGVEIQKRGGATRGAPAPAPVAKAKEEDVGDILKDVGDRLQAALTLAEGQETKLLEQLETVREKIEKTKETMRRMGFEPKAKEPESTLETEGD